MAVVGNSLGGALLAATAMAAAATCRADSPADPATDGAALGLVREARDLLHDGATHLETLLATHLTGRKLRGKPDWLIEQSADPILAFNEQAAVADSLQLVVQQDRRDGADLLTLRYPLNLAGPVRAYAGAGINQAVYFADSAAPGPTMLSGRSRHHSTGAAAELGARLRLSGQLMLNADVRWIGIDRNANLLRTQDGLVGADPVSFGVSLGWQFR